MHTVLRNRPSDPHATLLLAHGAGAPMDSDFMAALAAALAGEGVFVLRFEFPYMAARRSGARLPSPRGETLIGPFAEVVALAAEEAVGTLLIGGKSLGGRVAVMLAGTPRLDPRVAGVVCFGYPLSPPGRPGNVRLAPLQDARRPVLIVQGERDPFGGPEAFAPLDLPAGVRIVWSPDGDHDLKPRRAAPLTHGDAIRMAAAATAAFARAQAVR